MRQDLILEQGFQAESTNFVMGIIFSPWISLILFFSIIAVLVGIYFRFYKLIASCGLIAITIIIFRMFSSQLFGTYTLFQAKIIIPLFVLAMAAKLVSDYMEKSREEAKEEASAPNHKRKSIDATSRGSRLSRFGDEGRDFNHHNDDRFNETKSEMPIKLNRSF